MTTLKIIAIVAVVIILVVILVLVFLMRTAHPCHSDYTVYSGCGKILFIMDERYYVKDNQYLCPECYKKEVELATTLTFGPEVSEEDQPLPNNYENSNNKQTVQQEEQE